MHTYAHNSNISAHAYLYALSSSTEISPVIKLSKCLKTRPQGSDWEEIKENEGELTGGRCWFHCLMPYWDTLRNYCHQCSVRT